MAVKTQGEQHSGKHEPEEEFINGLKPLVSAGVEYPEQSKRDGHEGRVVIEFAISSSGKAFLPSLAESSGHNLLDRSALKYVKNKLRLDIAGVDQSKVVSQIFLLPIDFYFNLK